MPAPVLVLTSARDEGPAELAHDDGNPASRAVAFAGRAKGVVAAAGSLDRVAAVPQLKPRRRAHGRRIAGPQRLSNCCPINCRHLVPLRQRLSPTRPTMPR